MNLHVLVFSQPALRRVTPPSFEARRYAHSRTRLLHVLRAGSCIAGRHGRHPSYCFRGTTATHRRRRGSFTAPRTPCRGRPQTRRPFSCTPAFGRTSYARTTLAVVCDPLAIGRRRAISDLRLPALSPRRWRAGMPACRQLSPTTFSEGAGYYPHRASTLPPRLA